MSADLASLLQDLKERSGLSNRALGARINMSSSAVHRYCQGVGIPPEPEVVRAIGVTCKASPAELAELLRLCADVHSATARASSVSVTGELGPENPTEQEWQGSGARSATVRAISYRRAGLILVAAAILGATVVGLLALWEMSDGPVRQPPGESARATSSPTTSRTIAPRTLANDSRWTAVAASFKRDGGACPPLSPSTDHPRCGTCDLPSAASSSISCAGLFAEIDAFTFDGVDFYFDGRFYLKHTYVRIPPGTTTVRCVNREPRPSCTSGT